VLNLSVLGSVDLRAADGSELRVVLQQPKRLALLAYLALEASGRFVRRDVLLALFWPELDREHARAALRRALSFLRKAAGDGLIDTRGDEEVALVRGSLRCDATTFAEALARGDTREALALYRGDLLVGFYVAGAPEAEAWLDGLRDRLRAHAAEAAWQLAETATVPAEEAAAWGERAATLTPDDESGAIRLMRLLEHAGEYGRALRVFEALQLRLATDDDVPGSDATAAAQRIRSRLAQSAQGISRPSRPMVVAVLPFDVHGAGAPDYLSEGVVALLATALDGLAGIHTLTSHAVLSAVAAEGAAGRDAQSRAAERLSASHVIRGTLIVAGSRLRIVASIQTTEGAAVAQAEAEGDADVGLFDVLDSIVRQLVTAVAAGPASRLARVAARTTSSVPALRAYLLGERDFGRGRFVDAVTAYEEAVAADAGFGLAWYRLAGSRAALAESGLAREASSRAMAHRDRLAPHDRLLVEAQDAWLSGRLSDAERWYAVAVANQPDSLEAWYLMGDALFHAAPYHGRSIREAREPLERALALDPEHLGSLRKLALVAALENRQREFESYSERFLQRSPDADQVLAVRALRAFRSGSLADQAHLLAEFHTARAFDVAVAFGDILMYGGRLDEAEPLGLMLLLATRSPELRALCRTMLGGIALARGRTGPAEKYFDDARANDLRWSLGAETILLASPRLGLKDQRAAHTHEALTALEPSGDSYSSPPLDLHNLLQAHIRLYSLGLLAARAGDTRAVVEAGEQLAELDVPPRALVLVEHLARTLDALVRRSRGDVAGALAALEIVSPVWYQYAMASPIFSGAFERLLRAELLIEAGRTTEAIGWLDAIGERSPWELPFVGPARSLSAQAAARRSPPLPDR